MRNSMTQQRRFTKGFQEEAVRLAQTSGGTQREIAGDLGIGLSTLVRWIGRGRDRHALDPPAAESEVTADLKRLRAQQEVGRRHLLRIDPRRLAIPGLVIDLFSRRVGGWATGT